MGRALISPGVLPDSIGVANSRFPDGTLASVPFPLFAKKGPGTESGPLFSGHFPPNLLLDKVGPFPLPDPDPVTGSTRITTMRSPRLPGNLPFATLSACLVSLGAFASESTDPADPFVVSSDTENLLAQYCYDCHDGEIQKGDIQLDHLADLDLDKRLGLFNRMREQLYFAHMPPKEKAQPSEAERETLLAVLFEELDAHEASTLEGKLQKPEYGNYVDHEKLFSGEYADLPAFTYDRRWLISEYIFNAKFQRILKNETTAKRRGQRVPVFGSHRFRNFSLTNPYLLPTRSGVRYYATEDFTGGHLSSMLTNAQKASEYITDYLVPRHKGKYLPAVVEIMAIEDAHETTLTTRREFLENFIAPLCEEIYGERNESLLPAFTPVVLKEVKELEEGETYKKAPFHVAQNMLKGLEGDGTVYQFLMVPEHETKTDEEFQALCERTWFYYGDHERKIQGRMTILRDYLPEIRAHLEKDRRKFKPLVYEPLEETEMAIIKASLAPMVTMNSLAGL